MVVALKDIAMQLTAKPQVGIKKYTVAQLVAFHLEDIVHLSKHPVLFVRLGGIGSLRKLQAPPSFFSIILR